MSEAEQAAFTERVFAQELEGARILSNKSAWRALPVIRVKQWSVDKHVLLGDALQAHRRVREPSKAKLIAPDFRVRYGHLAPAGL